MFEFSGIFQPEHPILMYESKYNYSGVFDRIRVKAMIRPVKKQNSPRS